MKYTEEEEEVSLRIQSGQTGQKLADLAFGLLAVAFVLTLCFSENVTFIKVMPVVGSIIAYLVVHSLPTDPFKG